jgi:hypothetical protein
MLTQNPSNRNIIGIFVFIMVIFVYFPVVSTNYGYIDDYAFLQSVIDGNQGILTQAAAGDRILAGFLTQYLFDTFNSVNNLKYIRMLSVLFTSFLSICFYYFLTSSGYNNKSSAAFSLLSACTPSFQIYTSWAVLVSAPLSAFFAISAAFSHIRLNGSRLFIIRFLLVWISLLFYQPTAMLFFALIPVIIYSQLGIKNCSQIIKMIFLYVCSGFIAMLAAYLTLKANTAFGFGISPRSNLTTEFYSKLVWFMRGPLINSTNILMIKPQLLSMMFLFFALATLLICSKKSRNILFISSFFYVIPLSYTPNLVVSGDWASNRTTVALQVLWCSIIFLAFDSLIKRTNRIKFFDLSLFLLLAIVFLNAQNNVLEEFVVPGSIEYAYALHEIRKINPENNSTVCINPSKWYTTLAPYTSFDDFGMSPFSARWSVDAIFYDSLNYLYPSKKVKFTSKENDIKCKYSVNTSQLETYRTFKTNLYTMGSNQ